MRQTHSVADLKAMARENMLGKYGTAIVLAFTLNAISIVISLICEFTIDIGTIFGIVTLYIVQFIITLVMYIFSVGTYRFYLNICQNKPFNISDLFYGFTHHPDKAILVGLALTLMEVLCLLPFFGCLVAYMLMKKTMLIVAFTLTLILGLIALCYLTLTYSFALVLLADGRNDLSVIELLRESRNLMTGNRFRYFYMMVSFIGWALLGLLTCGIAFLWITPYINCTSTLFYLDICGSFPFHRPENPEPAPTESPADYHDYGSLY